MSDPDDSGTHPSVKAEPRGDEPPQDVPPAPPRTPGLLEEPEFQRFGKVLKIFLWPFMFSFGMAYVGGARSVDWLHFAGLGGVLLCMIALLVWLIS
ncbi:MAG: hypothetical protein OXT09_15445 [Myxococcales bacterium]|nr:hypothetical protein [Myxococcales bacterium]